MFTLSFHNLLYSYFSKEFSDIRTVSSAYKRANIFKYISNCAFSSLEILSKPVIFLSSVNCSRSFKNTTNKKGDKLSLCLRERPFNLKGEGGEVMVFFLKRYSDSQCCWKKYSDFGGGKKNNIIQSFCHKI